MSYHFAHKVVRLTPQSELNLSVSLIYLSPKLKLTHYIYTWVPEPFSFNSLYIRFPFLVPESFGSGSSNASTFPFCTDLTYLILKLHIIKHVTS